MQFQTDSDGVLLDPTAVPADELLRALLARTPEAEREIVIVDLSDEAWQARGSRR